ncbi:MAG: hypothetical protein J6Q54_01650 [Oscillospiraceae bacterium]|nr:hypothetical protein [Oscillospiraceae bacterium]
MKENPQDILEQLEQALWEEEDTEEETPEEDTEGLLTEPAGDSEMVYRNFSNRYGADLRNFANGYQVRNTDQVDVDLEEYSEEVAAGKKTPFPWVAILILLIAVFVVYYLITNVLGGIL